MKYVIAEPGRFLEMLEKFKELDVAVFQHGYDPTALPVQTSQVPTKSQSMPSAIDPAEYA